MKLKLNNLGNSMNRALKNMKFLAKKNSPEILLIFAGVGAVGSMIGACFATKKSCDILAASNADLDVLDARATEATDENVKNDIYQEMKKNKTITKLKVVGYYLPAVTGMSLSIVAGYGSHHILNKRYLGSVAYAAALNTAFTQYRNRVVKAYGEDIDKQLYYGAGFNDAANVIGNIDTEESNKIGYSETEEFPGFTLILDQSNPNARNGYDYLKMFVTCTENWANTMLQVDGHLYLSDVLDRLGVPKDDPKYKNLYKAAQVCGWWLDDDKSDGCVDFDQLDMVRPTGNPDDPYERYILLTFNVDGNIWEKM